MTGLPAEGVRSSEVIERIVLTGFMGSGKTTIGRQLAARLDWRFVDLDTAIEQRDGRTVAAIFAESGEPYFRQSESAELAASLKESQLVLALGGGALETPANRQTLACAEKTRIVLLSASFDTLYERCRQQIDSNKNSDLPVRPLLGDRDAAAARLARRDATYRQTAHLILDTTGQHPEQSVDALLELLRGTF
ncbi:MAG TPA: shikimate kinase [Candidatus Aquilonibacter sp.]|nr:shikimate kinase [Candidatus Aquilonibacter sp.]